ncbi:Nucleotide-binding protein [Chondrus crispus]|uniref:Cytosolic Fe-S cluster assembly factor NUBP1 homolog n=1 Tax=Chondrus crispus TaxID=2769 RepID=R7Q2Z8_CHOCR|nr:Nucleotide-binding protein [Chondrus crispus]CDF32273.1 Nucleotide-binding protein [Chondrus crispus]|eukprot:XP_005711938.1 Nucleotide-binding protein [Chondrus crispus]
MAVEETRKGAPQGEVPEDAATGCPGVEADTAGKADSCAGCPNQAACASGEAANKGPDPDVLAIARRLKTAVKHKILVLSGKGGVGKSTVAAQLSLALSANHSLDVGLLDVDVCGPSAPQMLGVSDEEVRMSNSGWSPVYVEENLGVMSIGFMLPTKDDAIIWRGVRKTGLIKQFLRDVDWGELDYLIVDAPPGTSDEHISLVQMLAESNVDGALIVTTPQEVSLIDVRKEINFCRKSGTRVLGVVENMAGFVCQHCQGCTDIFFPSSGGAERMCKEMDVPYLGKIPLDPSISRAGELGRSVFQEEGNAASPGVGALRKLVAKVRVTVGDLNKSEVSDEKSSEAAKVGNVSS